MLTAEQCQRIDVCHIDTDFPSMYMPSVVDCGMTSKNACDLVLVTRVGLHPLFSACA